MAPLNLPNDAVHPYRTMAPLKLPNDAVHLYMNDLRARIVAQTGIPTDQYHMGKLLLQSLRDAPDFLLQIDGGTGEKEINASVLRRTIQCALGMKKLGLQVGDVIGVMGPNHIHLTIPLYAAAYMGISACALDMNLAVKELTDNFNVSKPKIVFCEPDKEEEVEEALRLLGLKDSHIITFGDGKFLSFADFLGHSNDAKLVSEFQAVDFDPELVTMALVCTSGTTGVPKCAELTHKNIAIATPYLWTRATNFPTPTRLAFICSQLQWLTAIMNFYLSVLLRYTRLQSSKPITTEHAYYLINTYRPTYSLMSPNLLTTLTRPETRDQCDFTSLEIVMLGGSALHPSLIEDVQTISPKTEIFNIYGMTELSSVSFHCDKEPALSVGLPIGCSQYRLVDLDTMTDIMEPHVKGELWIKGPAIFKGYYNNPEATKATFAEDRWFRTGDMFYRDEYNYFYFGERIKLLLKYRNHQISPLEIESVISKHPGVEAVVVVGIPSVEHGELPLAAVVKKTEVPVTADEIKQIVIDNLTDSKQLRGGVVFFEKFPTTATTKVDRKKIGLLVREMERE